jgi:hypothetical protein
MNGRNGVGQTFTIAAVAFVCIARKTRRQSRLNHRANVGTITINITGQWRLTLRFACGCKRDSIRHT